MIFKDISFSEILDIATEILQILEERKEKAEESQAAIQSVTAHVPEPPAVHLQ